MNRIGISVYVLVKQKFIFTFKLYGKYQLENNEKLLYAL